MKAIHMAGISSTGANQVGLQTAPHVDKLRVAKLRKVNDDVVELICL